MFYLFLFYFSVLSLGLENLKRRDRPRTRISISFMASAMRLTHHPLASTHMHISSPLPTHSHSSSVFINSCRKNRLWFTRKGESLLLFGQQKLTPGGLTVAMFSRQNDGVVSSDDGEDGVSLGTMKLPSDTDLQRFESLLFQWANSLCQGANLPLPVPLKIDKIPGGARLGFITIEDGKTEVFVYIDCLVFPATSSSGPIFRAVRNGPLKDNPPPGEPRIMRSLLQALQKSVEIARVV